jgi:UDP:flavonoid glycosyltransferase YjiC (YdhE family)
MEHLAPNRAKDLVTAAARLAGVRALVQSKCAPTEGRDSDLFFLGWAPHERLLPLCSAMVLHGGAGTCHAALKAGVPAVIVPFIFEQGMWGGLMHEAGSATKPLAFFKATPDKLAARIREATTSPKLGARAVELAAIAATEDGVATAVRHIEAM